MILVLGATGYLGRAFGAELRKRKLAFTPLTRRVLDYTRFDDLFNYTRKLKPSFIINAAGHLGDAEPGTGEIDRAEILKANTLLPQTVARVCYLTNTPWGHVSSGRIYSGAKVTCNGSVVIERNIEKPEIRHLFEEHPEKFGGFNEDDPPNCTFRSPPCSFYSGSKALAEESLRWSEKSYLWRPNDLFDEFDHPRNFLSKLLKHVKLDDNVNSFSHRGDFVRACVDLWESRAPFGAYNIVNSGAATTAQFSAVIKGNGKIPSLVTSATEIKNAPQTNSTEFPASRILDASKLASAGVNLRTLWQAVEDSLQNWQATPQDDSWLTST